MKFHALVLITGLFFTKLFASETPLVIDARRSHIEAMVTAPMETFTVKLTAYDALISVDPQEKRIGSAVVKFRFADLKTGDEKRDAAMRVWQQTDQFPECVFLLDALQPAVGGTFKACGKFILHGVTQPFTIPVAIAFTSAETCVIDGDLSLDTTAFGLPPIRQHLILKVNPTLQITFHLEGKISAL